VGDVVRVRLRRETNVGTVSYHNHFYEVERIARAISGVISLDLIHFPVDSQNRSLVGLAVNAAVGNGYTVPTGRTDFTCDIAGRAVDNTPLPDVGETISPINDPPVETDPAELGNEPDDGPTDPVDNPEDPLDEPVTPDIDGGSGTGGQPLPGDTLTAGEVCAGQYNDWYLCPNNSSNVSDSCELVESGIAASYIADPTGTGKKVFVIGRCPDPSSPDGYGPPNESGGQEIGAAPLAPIYCPGAASSGGQGTFTQAVNVGAGAGSFSFSWEAFGIPDRFIITGAASYDTGSVSGSATVTVPKTSTGAWVYVQVIAPLSGTAWNYSVGCTV
jgi:hypothetical protein